jgi:lipoprotein-releasing system permease protein
MAEQRNLCAAKDFARAPACFGQNRVKIDDLAGTNQKMTEPQGTRPFAPFEWMLSLRYLRARRKEGFISVIAGFSFLGIMLGVATLIIVMAVMNGFRHELLDKILGLNGHLLIQPLEKPLTDWADVSARLDKAPGIKLAAPIVEGQALASSPFNAGGVLVRGIRLQDLEKLPSIANNIKQGSLQGFDSGQGVVIGRRLADQLSLRSGDNITLVAPRGAVTPMGTTPRIKIYKIAAVFEIGMSEYDSAMVFMPLPESQAYFNRKDDVTAIEVFTSNPDKIDSFRKLVTEAAERPIFIIDWRQRNATFFNALQVERNVMFLILTLIVLVAALNIVSGLIMLVKDKGQDIAILRTMGATQGAVMRVFLITGASIGVVGTLVGFLLGVIICLNIENIRQFLSWLTNTELFSPELYFLSHLPADMDTAETSAVVVMALVLSFLATLYPSWRAARLDPVEALRYE